MTPPPPMVQLNVGEIFVISCTAVGIPVPEVVWRLNWGHIPEKCTTKSSNGVGTLTCPDIQVRSDKFLEKKITKTVTDRRSRRLFLRSNQHSRFSFRSTRHYSSRQPKQNSLPRRLLQPRSHRPERMHYLFLLRRFVKLSLSRSLHISSKLFQTNNPASRTN